MSPPIISLSTDWPLFQLAKTPIVFKYPVIFFVFFRLQDSEKIERPLNWHQRLMSWPKQGILNNLLFKNGFGKTTRLAPVFSFLKNALYLNVDVFCSKVLTEGTVFFVSNWRRGRHFTYCHPSNAKVYRSAGQREYLHFSVILRPSLSTCPGPGQGSPALKSSRL